MEGIKEAFVKVKNDMDLLKKESNFYEDSIKENRSKIIELCNILDEIGNRLSKIEYDNINFINKLDDLYEKKKNQDIDLDKKTDVSTDIKTDYFIFSLNPLDNSTGNSGVEVISTENKTLNINFKPLNDQNKAISIGNEGVQTDKQIYRQTDIQMQNNSYNQEKEYIKNNFNKKELTANGIDSALNIIDSLDSIKKEIRLKFRRLTDQEMLVFSSIYQLEEEFTYSDYKMIAKKLSLTESSIRDYVRRLINKGIPIDKTKINNKEVHLSISPNLKKIASLNTILTLKDL